ncbi:Nascent polypeptide-associated complex subunit beta [Dispira simplex]|nr:Nascent polypeptide-associated complex subunit beta [Dispira simplex]
MEATKLAKLQSQVRIGGKGTPRRKIKKVGGGNVVEDKKLAPTLKKLNVQPLSNIEEVNMFRADGKILHFNRPKVQANPNANTFVVAGKGQEKDMSELLPSILPQLGQESMANLKKLAEIYQKAQKEGGAEEAGDEDIPDLVGDFDEATETKAEEAKEE